MAAVQGKIKVLRKNILVKDMSFEEQKTTSGIIIQNDDGKSFGVKPRWAQVWAVGPEQEEVAIGDWVYVEHGRWSRGFTYLNDSKEEITLRWVDPKSVLVKSNQKPEDYYVSE